jgi:hypothetical protein
MPPLLHVPELVKKAELCSCRWWQRTMMILVLFFTCNVFLFWTALYRSWSTNKETVRQVP